MPARLQLPESLSHLPYFVVRFHRDTGRYEVLEPHSANSYDLGDARTARAYFNRIGLEHLGGRALDSALAFGASQAWLKTNLAYGLDLCKVDLDAGISRPEDSDIDRRLLDGEDDEEEFVFVSGNVKLKD